MKGLDIKEVSGDYIKTTLQQLVEKRLGSKDVKIWVEPGSKKGDNTQCEFQPNILRMKFH